LGFQNAAVGRINGVAALMRFSFKKMYGRLAGTKQAAVIVNEVTVRWGSTVLERVIAGGEFIPVTVQEPQILFWTVS